MLCVYKYRRITSAIIRTLSQTAITNDSGLDYCTNIVRCRTFLVLCAHFAGRQYDYENFLATLLMTKALRSPALVVRAYNVEVARIQDQTSDAQTAAFRLQFWHDTIHTIFKKDQILKNIPAHPIAQELFRLSSYYNISKRHLEKLITARSGLLRTKHFKSLDEIEKYGEDTVSSIYYLLLGVAGVTNVNADHAASHLGKAQGITNILRSVHVSSHHKMVSLPMDILMQNKISQETVLRGIDSEDMRNVIFEVASRANSHLEKARKITVPKIVNQIFLPAIAVDTYLKRLQKTNFNVFDKSLHRGKATLAFNLYFTRLLNKF